MTFQLEASLLIWGSFWKGWLLDRGCSYHFCPEEKYGSKVFPKNGQFLVNVPRGINQGDFKVSQFWDLYFWSLKGFGRFKAVASLNAYQITNYQFPSKLIIFLLPDFQRIQEEVFKSGILWPIAWASVIKRFIWFFKIVPLEAPRSFIQMVSKWKGVFIEMDLLPTVITNSFKIQNQTFEKLFFVLTLWSWNLFLFRNIGKIHNDKDIWNTRSFISCTCWH